MQAQGIRGAAGVLLRGDDIDVTQALAGLHQRSQARREIAIVIGNQDSHAGGL
jgi:hypothetical protein